MNVFLVSTRGLAFMLGPLVAIISWNPRINPVFLKGLVFKTFLKIRFLLVFLIFVFVRQWDWFLSFTFILLCACFVFSSPRFTLTCMICALRYWFQNSVLYIQFQHHCGEKPSVSPAYSTAFTAFWLQRSSEPRQPAMLVWESDHFLWILGMPVLWVRKHGSWNPACKKHWLQFTV